MRFDLIKIYEWYDEPILFLSKSEFGDICVCMALEDQKYIMFKIDEISVNKLENEEYDLRELIINSPWCFAKIIDGIYVGEKFKEEKCSEEFLPDSGFFFVKRI